MTPTPFDALPDAPDLPGVLVEPSWLTARLGHPRLRVVDLRDQDAFAAGHVPGAARVDLAALGCDVGPCSNVLLTPGDFAALMSALGVSSSDAVIVYDDQWGLAAARMLWALHRYGHSAVAVLDGGWDRWTEEGGARSSETEVTSAGSFTPRPRADVYADLTWIEARVEDGGAVLVDTRSPAEYGRGHIPGAVGWDWFNAVPPESWNATRDPAELRAEWMAMGVEPAREVAVYCRSGMRAAHTYLALRHAGFERVRLYDGSWQEWEAHMKEIG